MTVIQQLLTFTDVRAFYHARESLTCSISLPILTAYMLR